MNLKLRIVSLEKEWEYFVQNFTGHVDTVRCLEITQKGFAINTKTIDEEKIIPSNPRQLRKLIENRKSIHFTIFLSPTRYLCYSSIQTDIHICLCSANISY